MKVEQIYTGCLAEAAYYIESDGEVAIIDPLRETKPYIEKAQADGAKIKYVLETHFHADFVSGHIDLAKESGATIVYGPTAEPNFEVHVAQDGEVLTLGRAKIKVLHTPGHTMESSTFLLIDEEGNDYGIFTGDTLFIGDVGRPDLAVKTDLSREDLAGHLYDSIRNKIMPLADSVIVYPGHGAGSACGKMMSEETIDTLGHQKKVNYALQEMSREDFVKKVTDGLVAPPQYFPKNAVMNKMGYDSIDEVLQRGTVELELDEFLSYGDQGALIIDTRTKEEFVKGFIPGSIFIGVDDNFAPWLGALVTDLKQPILLIADEGREEEIVTRMSRVGYDNALGFLKGGFKTWKDSGMDQDRIEELEPSSLEYLMKENGNFKLLDVRKTSEFESEHVVGSESFPLDFINSNMDKLSKDEIYLVYCKGGYRAVIALSILKARGYHNVKNIQGGFDAIKETGIQVSEYKEPSTML